jgi:tetratricopeptide (TPR) repeat protein
MISGGIGICGETNFVYGFQSTNSRSLSNSQQLERVVLRGYTRMYILDYAGALAVFEEGLKLDPDNAVLLSSLSEASRGSGDLESSLFYLQRALQSDPGNLFYLRDYAHIEFESGNVSGSIEAYNTLLQSDDALISDVLELIRLHALIDDLPSAARTAEYATERWGPNVDVLIQYADILERMGDSTTLANVLQQLTLDDPDDINLQTRRAIALIRSNDWPGAEDALNTILELDPENKVARDILAQAQSDGSNFDPELDLLIAESDATATSDISLAANTAESDEDLSTEQLKNLLSENPSRRDLQIMLADRLFDEDNFLEAAQRYEQIVQNEPRNLNAWVGCIEAYTLANEPQRGIDISDDALLLFPGFIPIEVSRVFALKAAGQLDQARELANTILGRSVDSQFESYVRRLERELEDA